MKILVLSLSLLSVPALAGSHMSLGGSAKVNQDQELKTSVGVSYGLGLAKGIAYWQWSGYGKAGDDKWFATQHGIDFSSGVIKIGPVVEYKLEEDDSEFSVGARASLKLW